MISKTFCLRYLMPDIHINKKKIVVNRKVVDSFRNFENMFSNFD